MSCCKRTLSGSTRMHSRGPVVTDSEPTVTSAARKAAHITRLLMQCARVTLSTAGTECGTNEVSQVHKATDFISSSLESDKTNMYSITDEEEISTQQKHISDCRMQKPY
jgi:hypothetical protein